MTVLSVNLNKVAWLRNSREGHRPSVIEAAHTVIKAGAGGVTVHPRPDLRHIRPHDVRDLARLLDDEYPNIEFNIEGNPEAGPNDSGYPGFSTLIEQARPAQATLVPDSDDQLTSDHGWDLLRFNPRLAELIAEYQRLGARVSLFMDPDLAQIDQAKAHGADRIELYTGPFAEAVFRYGVDAKASLDSVATYRSAAEHARNIGLGVNAGHDLDLTNLSMFCHNNPIDEVSIGHALIADALERGLFATVTAYLALLPS